jgi:hypothetical protein
MEAEDVSADAEEDPQKAEGDSSHKADVDTAKNDAPSSGEKKPPSAHPRMSGACPACSPSPIAPLRSSLDERSLPCLLPVAYRPLPLILG